jgi:hypothetical protein
MLAASAWTAFGIGAEIGLVGWSPGLELIVAPQWVRVVVPAAALMIVLLFLNDGVLSIVKPADSGSGDAPSVRPGALAASMIRPTVRVRVRVVGAVRILMSLTEHGDYR